MPPWQQNAVPNMAFTPQMYGGWQQFPGMGVYPGFAAGFYAQAYVPEQELRRPYKPRARQGLEIIDPATMKPIIMEDEIEETCLRV